MFHFNHPQEAAQLREKRKVGRKSFSFEAICEKLCIKMLLDKGRAQLPAYVKKCKSSETALICNCYASWLCASPCKVEQELSSSKRHIYTSLKLKL